MHSDNNNMNMHMYIYRCKESRKKESNSQDWCLQKKQCGVLKNEIKKLLVTLTRFEIGEFRVKKCVIFK